MLRGGVFSVCRCRGDTPASPLPAVVAHYGTVAVATGTVHDGGCCRRQGAVVTGKLGAWWNPGTYERRVSVLLSTVLSGELDAKLLLPFQRLAMVSAVRVMM